MLNAPSLLNSKQNDPLKKMEARSVTFVIITKDRPEMIKHLIRSILKARLSSFSLVLIDDSNSGNLLQTRSFLQPQSILFKQFSSMQAGQLVEEALEKTNLTAKEKNFIRNCTGLHSPFCGYVERYLEPNKSKLKPKSSGLQFAPYSTARNLGIYCAVRFFNPDVLLFFDDDCLILHPEKLRSRLRLVEMELNQKKIVAVAGLYKGLTYIRSERGIFKKIFGILRGMDAFLRKSFLVGEARFDIMPPHMLGGALILSKRVFHFVPFDPYVARGEDHAYALDLKNILGKNEIAVRDNHFIVGHQRVTVKKHTELNVLRDIFRFVYSHAKTGHSFIPLFLIRWTLISLINLFLDPSNYQQYKNELSALLFVAPKFAKENGSKFRRSIKAWNKFLCQLKE